MFASSRLKEFASCAFVARIVEDPVIRIVPHLVGMVDCVDIRVVVPLRAQVQEGIRLW